jgi:membrane fusion protein, multidrug efflux system
VRQDHVDLVPVILGRDYGDQVEIVSGIHARDSVIVNPNDSIVSGQQVRAAASGAQGE